ncbi:hypothetical protein MMC25_001147 [Agyrium rufum]|nr:hypothetical protein [Agyrium rufum]
MASTSTATNAPRLLIIGAGARGNAYARAVTESSCGIVAAVAEPIVFKREYLGRQYVWNKTGNRWPEQEFRDWRDFLKYETERRERLAVGDSDVPPGVDGVFICVQDALHKEVILGIAHLGLHVMSEKPLATTLEDCLEIYKSIQPDPAVPPNTVFSIGHVLRYSPHNMMLRKLLLQDKCIGDVISIEHTEPVGWWHFSHSYVRGNWRKEPTTAPSLLTKSCHDIDFLLWLLCSGPNGTNTNRHLPSRVSSTGSLSYFRPSRKPKLAGSATNCLSCPAERECKYSAKKIYVEKQLAKGNGGWPVHIVDPEIEDILPSQGYDPAKAKLIAKLSENYDRNTPASVIESRPWFGRCVYESDNDVCDDQHVTITWDADNETQTHNGSNRSSHTNGNPSAEPQGAKTAFFHMIAFTEKQCERRGRIYGTEGEIEYDSKNIRVFNFSTEEAKVHVAPQRGGGHGGGDARLASQFVEAIKSVRSGTMGVSQAQEEFIGCSLEDVIRSHAMVFCAEEARKTNKVIDWEQWWAANVLHKKP